MASNEYFLKIHLERAEEPVDWTNILPESTDFGVLKSPIRISGHGAGDSKSVAESSHTELHQKKPSGADKNTLIDKQEFDAFIKLLIQYGETSDHLLFQLNQIIKSVNFDFQLFLKGKEKIAREGDNITNKKIMVVFEEERKKDTVSDLVRDFSLKGVFLFRATVEKYKKLQNIKKPFIDHILISLAKSELKNKLERLAWECIIDHIKIDSTPLTIEAAQKIGLLREIANCLASKFSAAARICLSLSKQNVGDQYFSNGESWKKLPNIYYECFPENPAVSDENEELNEGSGLIFSNEDSKSSAEFDALLSKVSDGVLQGYFRREDNKMSSISRELRDAWRRMDEEYRESLASGFGEELTRYAGQSGSVMGSSILTIDEVMSSDRVTGSMAFDLATRNRARADVSQMLSPSPLTWRFDASRTVAADDSNYPWRLSNPMADMSAGGARDLMDVINTRMSRS